MTYYFENYECIYYDGKNIEELQQFTGDPKTVIMETNIFFLKYYELQSGEYKYKIIPARDVENLALQHPGVPLYSWIKGLYKQLVENASKFKNKHIGDLTFSEHPNVPEAIFKLLYKPGIYRKTLYELLEANREMLGFLYSPIKSYFDTKI